MILHRLKQKSIIIFFTGLLGLLLLAACGGSNASSGSTPSSTSPAAKATAAETALMQEMTIIGSPTAKLTSGTNFVVNGQIKNGDSKQHDIYLQVVLLDSSGKAIVTLAPFNVDNVKGGTIASFSIPGITPQATWQTVQVTVVKVTENLNGAGGD